MRIIEERTRPVFKDFKLTGHANASIDLGAGEEVITINDVSPENSVMGIEINHVFSGESGTNGTGVGFRLNLEESLVESNGYVYTDGNGRKYKFTEYFYYLENDKKVYVDKSKVSTDENGIINYNWNRVFVEYRSATGLTLVAPLKGISKIDMFLEQRNENLRQAQEKRDSLIRVLEEDYEYMLTETGEVCYGDLYGRSYETSFMLDIIDGAKRDTYTLIPKSMIATYEGLKLQKSMLDEQIKSYNNQKTMSTLTVNSIQYQIDTMDNSQAPTVQTYVNVQTQVATNANIRTNLCKQKEYYNSTQTADINALIEELNKQRKETDIQIAEFSERNRTIAEQYESHYKSFIFACREVEKYERQIVEKFLTDGKTYKGFNAYGELIAIFDSYQNNVVIERERNRGRMYEWRIMRMYNDQGQSVSFNYTSNGTLKSIVDNKGNTVNCKYNSGGRASIKKSTGEEYTFEYENGKILTITEKLSNQKCVFVYSNGKIVEIEKYSLETNENGEYLLLDKVGIEYSLNSNSTVRSVITSNGEQREGYFFNSDKNLEEYRLEEKGVVIEATRYEHVPYWSGKVANNNPREVITSTKKNTLYTSSIEDFVFVAGHKKTTVLNEYEKPEKTTYSSKKVGGSNVQKSVTIEYFYDDNQKLIEEKTSEKYNNISKLIISHKKYTYNPRGEITKIVSYVEEREQTYGKDVEEFIYDDMGNVVKSFTYNTIDSSTKFYEERKIDETGKVVAQKSPTGENETKYVYADNLLTEEILPNGSKFAYGYDENENLTAIAHSTIDGESNSTERVYQNGLLITLKSGKNEIHYTYDYKKRIKSIDLNDTTNYLTYTYTDDVDYNGVKADIVLATYAPRKSGETSDTVETIKDKQGNVLCVKINGIVQQECSYKNAKIDTIEDKISHLKVKYNRDDIDNVTSIVSVDENGESNKDYIERHVYDGRSRLERSEINDKVFKTSYKGYTIDLVDSTVCDGEKTKYYYDVYNRIIKKEYISSNTKRHEIQYSYLKKGDHATNLVSTVRYGYKLSNNKYFVYDMINYTYDNMNNITHVRKNGVIVERYTYDDLGRLVREDNKVLNKTCTYLYDNSGNILFKKNYGFTLCNSIELEDKEPTSITQNKYGYDQLKETGPYTCTYDKLGNPTIYKGKSMTWECGRRLKKYKDIELSYDGFGRRIKKGDLEFTYDLSGRLLRQSNGIEYIFADKEIIGFNYTTITQGETLEDGTIEEIKTTKKYYYQKDLMGNVIALLDEKGMEVLKYAYDAWGNHKVLDLDGEEITDTTNIGHVNPIRYRSYYYDSDFGFYYLNTRYYDPKIGRFINMDDTAFLAPDVINGLNLYAYCGNNPVMHSDPYGTTEWWEWFVAGLLFVGCIVGAVFTGGTSLVGAAFIGAAIGGGASIVTQAITTGTLNWGQLALDMGTGAISGAIGASGITSLGSMIVGGAVGGVSNIASQLISGKSFAEINWLKVGISTIISGAASAFGGAGIRNTMKLNDAPEVKAAIESVNKVLARQTSGYYSSVRYAQAALTNVANRLGKTLSAQQVKMMRETLSWFGGGTFAFNIIDGILGTTVSGW